VAAVAGLSKPSVTSKVDQSARTPYAADFIRDGTDFILTIVHVLWGMAPADRIGELTAFAKRMRGWADRPEDGNRNLLVLGDFNLDRTDDPLFDAFVSTGLWPPAELNDVPRTVFDDDKHHHHYDQIAWFSDPTKPNMPSLLDGLTYTGQGGSFRLHPPRTPRADQDPGLLAAERPLRALACVQRVTGADHLARAGPGLGPPAPRRAWRAQATWRR
jgi:hypothetical protein